MKICTMLLILTLSNPDLFSSLSNMILQLLKYWLVNKYLPMLAAPVMTAILNMTEYFQFNLFDSICQFKDNVYGLMTGLFAWISLTALSWTVFTD